MSQGEFIPGPAGMGAEHLGQVPPIPPDQQAFIDRLRMVNARVVRPLPDLAPRVDHTGVVRDTTDLVRDLNVNMASDVLQPFAEADERPGRFSFAPRRLAGFGKERTFRDAFFGVLTMEEEGGHVEQVPVVVKQFPLGGHDDASHNAMQEVTMLEHVKALGLPTVDVAGVIVDRYTERPRIYVITRRRPELESLDELQWQGLQTADLADRLHPVVDTLSTLHGNLVFHGDPKFKNIGLDEEGKPIIFDLEHATSVRDLVDGMTAENEEEVLQLVADRMSTDFGHVTHSLNNIVYPNLPQDQCPQTPMEQFDFEVSHVLEPYQLRLMEGNSPYKVVLNRVYNRVLQQRRTLAQKQQAAHDGSGPAS